MFKVTRFIDVVYTVIFSLIKVFVLVLLAEQLFKFGFPNQNFFLNSLHSFLRECWATSSCNFSDSSTKSCKVHFIGWCQTLSSPFSLPQYECFYVFKYSSWLNKTVKSLKICFFPFPTLHSKLFKISIAFDIFSTRKKRQWFLYNSLLRWRGLYFTIDSS